MKINYWVDKYMPQRIDNIIGHESIKIQIKNMINTKNVPNLILSGNCGIGKTCIINAMTNELLLNIENPNILYIKTITEKNTKIIKQIINDYIKKKIHHKKIIIIEDIDTLPDCIQYPIASLLDNKDIIFLLSSNRICKLINILQSKCLLISLFPLTTIEITNYLAKICHDEDIQYNTNALVLITEYSDHDIRKAINTLQMIQNSYKKITIKNVKKILTNSLYFYVKQYLNFCYKKNIKEAIKLVTKLLDLGYDVSDFFSIATLESQTHIFCDNIIENKHHQIIFIELIGNFYSKLVFGVLTNIQIYALTYELCHDHDINKLIIKQ